MSNSSEFAITQQPSTETTPSDVSKGWGADQNPLERPGVPQESDPPEPLASAHWLEPEPQFNVTTPLVGQGRQLTPVFSSAIPARGLSGAIRKVAYRIPDYRARRWLLLMVADRVDVIEHRPGRLLGVMLAVSLLSVGAFSLRRLTRS